MAEAAPEVAEPCSGTACTQTRVQAIFFFLREMENSFELLRFGPSEKG